MGTDVSMVVAYEGEDEFVVWGYVSVVPRIASTSTTWSVSLKPVWPESSRSTSVASKPCPVMAAASTVAARRCRCSRRRRQAL